MLDQQTANIIKKVIYNDDQTDCSMHLRCRYVGGIKMMLSKSSIVLAHYCAFQWRMGEDESFLLICGYNCLEIRKTM